MFAVDYFVFSRCTRLTDGQTDRQISTARPCVCISSCTVKKLGPRYWQVLYELWQVRVYQSLRQTIITTVRKKHVLKVCT